MGKLSVWHNAKAGEAVKYGRKNPLKQLRQKIEVTVMKNSNKPSSENREKQDEKNSPLTLTEVFSILTPRKCEILKKIGEGKGNHQIAEELFLSLKTVENHITEIGKMVGVSGKGKLREWMQTQKAGPGRRTGR